ncbi:adenosylcobalamin-dependent ribonucleoside-diphosphate reductase [Candidatus Wolfebacteria bacterium]|nr:adenosylcobalamin-dependent ribonucleoside-diphosphate reductase [Candidatus Wolfebacteria bacterium]
MKFQHIRKRNGQLTPFEIEKITNAIYRASVAVGQPNWQLATDFSKEVIRRLQKKIKKGAVPAVEEVQDIVEQVLIEKVHPRIAKAYILYRQHRAEIRKEKEQILNKEEIDEVDKKFDINALRVLASRYLRKDESGKIIESPKQLFERVAVHTAISSIFYDAKIYKKAGGAQERHYEEFDPAKFDGKLAIGKYKLNKFHLEGVKRIYDRLSKARKIKISWQKFLDLFKKGYFDKYENEISSYYNLMVARRFMPNTPALANFGNHFGMGSACFVLGIEDSIDSIMNTLKAAATIFKSGGGVGYNFSHLRPEGDFIKTTGGVSSGPISFMSMFDNMTDVIKQGGIRRGANMGILNSDHPDIDKFIKAKEGNKALRNFNISIMVKPEFWRCLKENKPYSLINPRSGKVEKEIDAKQLFDMITYQVWESAEPGILFYDRINEYNPFAKSLGEIECTNPCGEVILYPNESCNLGSINVWEYLKKNGGKKPYFDWPALERDIKISTRFLDNVVDINKYPLLEIEETTLNTRKLGLGVMGVADLLYELEISYASKQCLEFMERLMEFVNYHSKSASIELSRERGRMPYFDKSFYKEGKLPFSGFKDKKSWNFDWNDIIKKIKKYGIRNSFNTVIAPTGSISMLAGCSSGIEPVFSLVFEKSVAIGNFYYVDPVFEEKMRKEGLMDEDLIKDAAVLNGSIRNIPYIPEHIKKIFTTAMDISPVDHIKVLAAFQKWTDSSISKTNNFSMDALVDDIKKAYLLAYELGCKGVTVYRDKSLKNQVLIGGSTKKKLKDKELRHKDAADHLTLVKKDEKTKGLAVYSEAGANISDNPSNSLNLSPAQEELKNNNGFKKCPACGVLLVKQEGCNKCPACGWGLCA